MPRSSATTSPPGASAPDSRSAVAPSSVQLITCATPRLRRRSYWETSLGMEGATATRETNMPSEKPAPLPAGRLILEPLPAMNLVSAGNSSSMASSSMDSAAPEAMASMSGSAPEKRLSCTTDSETVPVSDPIDE
ncbi:MAG: hypothetical protein BWX47_01406 [candidate division Hyd24-12 bacterium ADurb.Bin004]|nr:MAG: hypothetical protein BWX47_01406 [candidate division Hyd24-12 bacterium ADurb.Bin004]